MLLEPGTMSAYRRNFTFLTTLFCLFFFAACAGVPPEKVTESDQDGCQRLKEVIAGYPSKFATLRHGAPSSNPWNNANVWKAEPLFSGTECQIWGWAKGLSNYSCQWKESGQETAQAAYDKYTPKILSCLGSKWSMSNPEAKTGKQTLFQNKSTSAVVSIRYFQDTRPPFSKPWYTSMIIGDPIQTVKD